MPANIAHMLICHKAIERVNNLLKETEQGFFKIIDQTEPVDYRAYLNLGSMGPDLFYYSEPLKTVHDLIFDKRAQASGVELWSYNLHSINPREFAVKLLSLVFRDAIKEGNKYKIEEIDLKKVAFIAGYLTHVAADQIIHPLINEIAGPYYRQGINRSKHREAEVFQDYTLYRDVYTAENKGGYKYDFNRQHFNEWADCIKSITTRNTEDWFIYFIQRGFVETFYTFPSKEVIEGSVDHLLDFLRLCNKSYIFNTAVEEFSKPNSEIKDNYYENRKYLNYYRVAVELSSVYLLAMLQSYKVLTSENADENDAAKLFEKVVSNSDLACPLEPYILDTAIDNAQKVLSLATSFEKGKVLLKEQSIMDLKDKKEIVILS